MKKGKTKWLIIAVAVIGAVGVGWLLMRKITLPVEIVKIETNNALSSRMVGAVAKDRFGVGEPVMLYFEYNDARVGDKVDFEVTDKDGAVVKSGATTVLRPGEGDDKNGRRYVSIVNTGSTELGTGKYKIVLSVDGREVASTRFGVE